MQRLRSSSQNQQWIGDSHYLEWFRQVRQATEDAGKPIIGVIDAIHDSLNVGGYCMTSNKKERLHLVRDCRLKDPGALPHILADRHCDLLRDSTLGHMEALSMRLLTQRGWTPAEVRSLCKAARKDLEDWQDRVDSGFLPFHVLCILQQSLSVLSIRPS